MALPRRLVKAIKAGQYQPSAASKKAREAAANLRDRQPPPQPPGRGAPPRDRFVSIRDRVIRAKHEAYYGTKGYNPRESVRSVREAEDSEEIDDIMEESLQMSSEEMKELASLAAKAHIAQAKTGSAGELEEYLQYDFLFYH